MKLLLVAKDYLTYRALKLYSKDRAKQYRASQAFKNNIAGKIFDKGELHPGPIVVIGFFSGVSGLGSAARNLVAALRDISDQVYTVDVSWIHSHLVKCTTWTDRTPPPGTAGGTRIYCVNPPEVLRLLAKTEADELLHTKLIGYWWWELDIIPPGWREISEAFDEIWTSSHFIENAFKRSVKTKVTYIPPVVRIADPLVYSFNVRHPIVSEGEFTVLCAFDVGSYVSRKNPMAAIQAFQKAFGGAADRHLVIKVLHGQQHPEELLKLIDATKDLKKVTFLTDTLDSIEFANLIASSSVYISLHRSEGLGLILIEAMLLGTPVVATGWSGPLDFLTDQNSGLVSYVLRDVAINEYAENVSLAKWAEPSVDDAAMWLLKLEADPLLRSRMSKAAFDTVITQFGGSSTRAALAAAVLEPTGNVSLL